MMRATIDNRTLKVFALALSLVASLGAETAQAAQRTQKAQTAGASEFADIKNRNCSEDAAVKREFFSTFNVSNKDRTLTYRDCDFANPMYVTARALYFLKKLPKLQRHSDVGLDLDRLGKASGPRAYVQSNVKNVVFLPENDPACATDSASYKKNWASDEPGEMRICPVVGERTPFFTASILVHEARHGEDLTPHVRCSRGPHSKRDILACDDSYLSGDAYYLETEFFIKMAQTPALNRATRSTARSLAATRLAAHFNKFPLIALQDIKDGVALQAVNGDLYFFNGHNFLKMQSFKPDELVTHTPREGDLGDSVEVFSLSNGNAWGYYFTKDHVGIERTGSAIYTGFSEGLDQPNRAKVREVFDGPNYHCYIAASDMVCVHPSGEKFVPVKLPAEFSSILYSNIPDLSVIPTKTYLLRTADGELYRMPETYSELERGGAGALTHIGMSTNALSVLPWKNEGAIGLGRKGQLFWLWQEDGKVVSREIETELQFKKLLAPMRWSKEFEKL